MTLFVATGIIAYICRLLLIPKLMNAMSGLKNTLFIACAFFLAGCSSWKIPALSVDAEPDIFPDYKDVMIPCNIAPLNFMVEGAERIQAEFSVDGEVVLTVAGGAVLSIPEKKWRGMMSSSKNRKLSVEVSLWSEDYPDGVRYLPFQVNVASDEIDPWIAYRLIEPGYRGWRQLGLYQREISSFRESVIVSNASENETCLNCHHFPAYSSRSMMFHTRGADGGTFIYHGGRLEKIKFNEIGPKKNTTYPAWHPDGRFIAFSANTTRQIFFVHGKKPIEVFDTASDLVIYDTETGKVITDPRFMTAGMLETFPAWSPDGKYLYYVAEEARNLPDEIEEMHYDLMRVSFDSSTGTFGEDVEVICDSAQEGGSISHPRISPDGRYLLYTRTDYGTFPIWHEEADLKMMDLVTDEHVDISLWNDPDNADSYHAWSSDGRWVMFGSRRLDGRYTRLYIAYMDEDGTPCKPFLLPQEDPRNNLWWLKSYNIPEFIDGEVELPEVQQL